MNPDLQNKLKVAKLPENLQDIIDHICRIDYADGIICGKITSIGWEAVLTLKLFVNIPSALKGPDLKKIDHLLHGSDGWYMFFEDGSSTKVSSLIIY